jgi:dipeptidase E
MDDPVLDRFVLGLVDTSRPNVCFLPTATSAVPVYAVRFFQAFPATSFDTSFLDLFERDGRDLRAFLLEQDVIYVGGGNTANLLAIWRAHGLDAILREAWQAGVVLAGVSAGANCGRCSTG